MRKYRVAVWKYRSVFKRVRIHASTSILSVCHFEKQDVTSFSLCSLVSISLRISLMPSSLSVVSSLINDFILLMSSFLCVVSLSRDACILLYFLCKSSTSSLSCPFNFFSSAVFSLRTSNSADFEI